MSIFAASASLAPARAQMVLTLAFHMIFAAVGIGLPLLMVIAESRYRKTNRPHYLAIAKKWAKAAGLLFAVGAVSGTALAFELGLLWPRYMEITGAAVGHLFALEGYAFFTEAIFLGLYLYGWDRLAPSLHWFCGIVVALSGAISGIMVLGVNAWMQQPIGFELDSAGRVISTQPFAIFQTYAWFTMALHSTLSCYIAVGFASAAIYAIAYLRGQRDDYVKSAFRISMTVAAISAIAMPLSGDLLAKFVFKTQPAKLAAMESHFETQANAPLVIGGWPDVENRSITGAIKIPGMLSFLASGKTSTVVTGLNDIPRELWPNVPITHASFQIMVGLGTLMLIAGACWFILWWRRRDSAMEPRWFLRLIALLGPAGFIALEAGWMVTEVGRQPWVIQGHLLTADAVTPVQNVWPTFWGFTLLYVVLAVVVIVLLKRLSMKQS